MSRLLALVLFVAAMPVTKSDAATLSSEKKVSTARDAWGHRPGPRGFSTVILDAGHGGKDPGAVSPFTEQQEKDLALDMVKRVQAELRGQVHTAFTRRTDVFVDLDDRVRFANRYADAVLVSIHFNAGSSRLSGPEVYYWRVDSYTLAKRVQSSLTQASVGIITSRGLVRRRLRLTRNPQIPCILVECGYLSSGSESWTIRKAEYRSRLAKAIAKAILDQRSDGDSRLGPLPKPLYEPLSKASDRRE